MSADCSATPQAGSVGKPLAEHSHQVAIMGTKDSSCSCRFDQTMGALNIAFYRPRNEGFLTLEQIISLDWNISCLIQQTRDCSRCYDDLAVMATIHSTLETILLLLEAAQTAYARRADREGKQTPPEIMNELLDRRSDGRIKDARSSQFVLGRVALGEDDSNMIARRLVTTAISRKAGVIRDLRERINNCTGDPRESSQSDGKDYTLSRQARDMYDELDGKMASTSARVCSAVARASMYR